uniref:MICOS complex subunit n=1 Tax=Callorhinchus milii TaxID=7868 RepID=V9L2N8_CALMI
MAAQVVKLAALPVSLGLIPFQVYASNESKQEKQLIRPEQLSVYTAPHTNFKYIQEQPGRLEEGLSVVRQTIQPYAAKCKGAYAAFKIGAQNTAAFGKNAYVFLKNPPSGFLPRVSVITVSGLAGLILASRGSRFKKVLYPSGLATVGMAICYPQQAIAAAKFSGKKVSAASQWGYDAVGSLWKGNAEKKKETKKKPSTQKEPPKQETLNNMGSTKSQAAPLSEVLSQKSVNTEGSRVPTKGKENKILDPNLMDHGQSHPEDKDLYSTRS